MKSPPQPRNTKSPDPGSWLTATLVVTGLMFAGLLVATEPVYQDPAYHNFADPRKLFGIPNALDVLSNIGFVITGVLGIFLVRSAFNLSSRTRLIYLVFFTGIILTGLGSSWYHLEPNNYTLVWDRLPMTIAFMTFTTLVIKERIDGNMGYRLMPWLIAAGFLSVLYWVATGDLRPYLFVQFGPMLALPVIIARFDGPGTVWLWIVIGFYVLAKILEVYDPEIFEITGNLVSGHTLKHMAAAAGSFSIAIKVFVARGLVKP